MAEGPARLTIQIVASLGHLAVGMFAGRAFAAGTALRPASSMFLFAGLSLLPDADYLGVSMGLANEGPLGHRGASHGLLLPILVGAVAFGLAPRLRVPRWRLALVAALVVSSHALLDAMTGGGSRGVPLFWPLSFHRFEAPWRPIPNAPCGLAYVSSTGLRVAATEMLQFAPFLIYALRPGPSPTPTAAKGHGGVPDQASAPPLAKQSSVGP